MADSTISTTQGRARVAVDMRDVWRVADRITGGALVAFMKAAHRQMDPVVQSAPKTWPVRSGRSAESNVVEDRLKADEASVVALNRAPYAYYIKYSVRTVASIEGEVRDTAARLGSQYYQAVWWYAKRGNSPGAQIKIANHFMLASTDGMFTNWAGGHVSQAVLAARIAKRTAARLRAIHGRGAPSDRLAGRNVWQVLVARPVKAAEDKVVEESRDALDRLARG